MNLKQKMKYLLLSFLLLTGCCASKTSVNDKRFTVLQDIKIVSGFYKGQIGIVINFYGQLLSKDTWQNCYTIRFSDERLKDDYVCASDMEQL